MQEHSEIIQHIRARMGDRLYILGHHYQADEVVAHVDSVGDSLELARQIPELRAEYIVMCGVYFMAETASVLASEKQSVFIPDPEAGCTLDELAPARLVEAAVQDLNRYMRVVPLAYVNTSAAVKSICGRYGGSVCTSANASTMLDWALDQAEGVLFLPDKNLALNVARDLGIGSQRLNYSFDARHSQSGTVFVWPGICDMHTAFRASQIAAVREKDPEARIILHPECPSELVTMADSSGSTSNIIRYVQQAPFGSRIYVGTEINMVQRLARRFQGEKAVMPLQSCDCPYMGRITPGLLAETLQGIESGSLEPVEVEEITSYWSRVAVNRMLEACS